ncbi:acyl-CoA dehydrogenase family member 9, mitochondrial [Ostrinia furnacalis]|nr:acyl-CoA dehydrogenase family member 9, mitochondrial [Ostrinia furnacalis]
MNLARRIYSIRYPSVRQNFDRKLRLSAINYESTQATQPQIKEEKFDFEDLKVLERVERRKPKIKPFMKDVFVSVFNKELLAFPEIINKEESENLDQRVAALDRVFSDPEKTKEDRKTALKRTMMYAAPVSLTNNGLAMNITESLRYLEVISTDLSLGQEISDHWVGLEALRRGLEVDQYQQIVDDLITGDKPISLCIKERVSERITQPDFRTTAELDPQGIWRITGEKVCQNADGYLLVLCSIEAGRLKGFLVHPGVEGVSHDGNFVNFLRVPATPLNVISEDGLAQTLSASRLYAATLCRVALRRAVQACMDYIKPRFYSGKPLSELSTVRTTIGDALLDLYASESSEYFTAGLMDGYEDPDAELEMAMCRIFMTNHGLSSMMRLLAIPTLEKEEECKQILNDMRHLVARGDSLDGVSMYVALNGIHHAGKMMSEEIRQVRNPLFHPAFIFKKVIANRKQEKDDPKLTLYLIEHLHPTLKQPAEDLEYSVLRMRYACETMMSRHGVEVGKAFTELNRLAEAATEILAMTSVLARASR